MTSIHEKQIHTDEQQVVLRTLAESVAKTNCKLLEVGSWCGDSAVLFGKIAKENNGHLYCIDWWKGSTGTELAAIAQKTDVFSFFWNRIRNEGLEDVVIPIRSSSDLAAEILKKNSFDLVFLDADHRYEAISNDIKRYMPLVKKKNGILCGHDCEGRLCDYDLSFLEAGKDRDLYQSVHCGAVLAVGLAFKDYSVNHAIWSVLANNNNWKPTNLTYPGIVDKRQTPLPPIGISKNYMFQRYGRTVYAIPYSLSHIDLREESQQDNNDIIKAEDLGKAEGIVGEKIYNPPVFLEPYRDFDLLDFEGNIYALKKTVLGHWDLVRADEKILKSFRESGCLFVGESSDKVKSLVDESDKDSTIKSLKKEVEKNHEHIKEFQSSISERDIQIAALNDEIAARDGIIQSQKKELETKSQNIIELQKNISGQDATVEALRADIGVRNDTIQRQAEELGASGLKVEELQQNVAGRDAQIASLNNEIAAQNDVIQGLEQDRNVKKQSIAELQENISDRDATVEALRGELAARDNTIDSQMEDLSAKSSRIEELQQNIADRDAKISAMNNEIVTRDGIIQSQEKELKTKEQSIAELQKNISGRDATIDALRADIGGRDNTIQGQAEELDARGLKVEKLHQNIAEKDAKITALNNEIAARDGIIQSQEKELKAQEQGIAELQKEISDRNSIIETSKNELKKIKSSWTFRFCKFVSRKS